MRRTWPYAFAAIALMASACEDTIVSQVDPILNVSPKHIDFGTVELTQQKVEIVRIQNLESVVAKITAIEVTDDCNGCFFVQNPIDELNGHGVHELQVRFRATQLEEASGSVAIMSDDPKAPFVEITMVGRGSDMRRPCIEVAPEAIDYGFVPAGGIALGSFVVRSCGTNTLLIDKVWVDPPGAPFRITTSTPAAEPAMMEPGAQASVSVRAQLPETVTGTVTGRILIQTNVIEVQNVPGMAGLVQVPLRGLANLPPVAVPGEDLTVEPWSRVTMDGSASYDQDDPPDDPLTYRWRLVSKPGGSTTVLERATTFAPSFWADLTGTYEVELVVIDGLGLESAPESIVIEALPAEAVHIELTWDHPDSDLDLHFMRATFEFCDCITDVHYRDCGRAPNWYPATPGANPRLDVDDRSGFGPENINIDGDGTARFIPPGDYQLAVHYYASNSEISSWPTSESNATVRVFVFGLLTAELNRTMMMDGDLWHVGRLGWPTGEITPTNAYLQGILCPER